MSTEISYNINVKKISQYNDIPNDNILSNSYFILDYNIYNPYIKHYFNENYKVKYNKLKDDVIKDINNGISDNYNSIMTYIKNVQTTDINLIETSKNLSYSYTHSSVSDSYLKLKNNIDNNLLSAYNNDNITKNLTYSYINSSYNKLYTYIDNNLTLNKTLCYTYSYINTKKSYDDLYTYIENSYNNVYNYINDLNNDTNKNLSQYIDINKNFSYEYTNKEIIQVSENFDTYKNLSYEYTNKKLQDIQTYSYNYTYSSFNNLNTKVNDNNNSTVSSLNNIKLSTYKYINECYETSKVLSYKYAYDLSYNSYNGLISYISDNINKFSDSSYWVYNTIMGSYTYVGAIDTIKEISYWFQTSNDGLNSYTSYTKMMQLITDSLNGYSYLYNSYIPNYYNKLFSYSSNVMNSISNSYHNINGDKIMMNNSMTYTTYWGKTRNLTIGSYTKTINGSSDIVFTLEDINAKERNDIVDYSSSTTYSGIILPDKYYIFGSYANPITSFTVTSLSNSPTDSSNLKYHEYMIRLIVGTNGCTVTIPDIKWIGDDSDFTDSGYYDISIVRGIAVKANSSL